LVAEPGEKTSPIAATPSAMDPCAVVKNSPAADPASSPETPLLPIIALIIAGCTRPWPPWPPRILDGAREPAQDESGAAEDDRAPCNAPGGCCDRDGRTDARPRPTPTPLRGGDMLNPGDKAPDFDGRDHNGNTVKLSDFKGKSVVIWFFPKADTPG
jgi:hypothetical protein